LYKESEIVISAQQGRGEALIIMNLAEGVGGCNGDQSTFSDIIITTLVYY
jgi:hypothetical protein